VDERAFRQPCFGQLGSRGGGNWASRVLYPLHQQVPYAANALLFPVSRSISAGGLWLPSRFDLSEEQIERTARVMRLSLQRTGQEAA
jgi:dTDP-4-amino-4,6-dideoxygalactose transaminase